MSHRTTPTEGRRTRGGAHGLTRHARRLVFSLSLAILAPSPLHAADLAIPERVITGYEDGARFRVPKGVALDPARGELVVANTGEHRIEIFSLKGRPLGRFVHMVALPEGGTGPGLPRSVAVLPTGRIAITDALSPAVDIVDRRGRSVATLTIPSSAKAAPQALAVTPDGGLLVAGPPGDDRVHRFDASFRLVASWGARGHEPGSLDAISGLAFLPDGRIAVICVETKYGVQIFTQDGVYVSGFGVHDTGHGNVSLPSGIAVTADGRIWVADEIRQVIQAYDPDGTYLGMLGGFGLAPGDLNYPSALAGDGGQRLAVAERELGRVQILTTNGGGEDSGSHVSSQ